MTDTNPLPAPGTDDFTAVLAAIHETAVSSPAAAGETADYQRGWDEAMAAVAAIAGTYEPSFAYEGDDGHITFEAQASSLTAIHRLGFTVRRRAVGPWEPVPHGAVI
ncbi:hypothetical protein [Arthrobacter sp. IK3]|uniref:hypothetical protein n=1 Tax=Arthrobacter sp. IK3 TaxID=3448169 RepID=UPI003EE045C8